MKGWVIDQLQIAGGRRRSLNLPAGRLGFRKLQPHVVINDKAQLLAWCREHLPDALRVHVDATGPDVEALLRQVADRFPDAKVETFASKAVISKSVRETGEVPAGTEVVTVETFYME